MYVSDAKDSSLLWSFMFLILGFEVFLPWLFGSDFYGQGENCRRFVANVKILWKNKWIYPGEYNSV